jgi:hypothetical protein
MLKRNRGIATTLGSTARNVAFAVLVAVILLLISYSLPADKPPFDVFWRLALHELGFALIVASIIWIAFEVFRQEETDERWNERIERISQNVFFGVFKKNFPDELIREAQRLVLEQNFVRSGLQITYNLIDDKFVDHNNNECLFVKVNAVGLFNIRNVANDHRKFPVVISLPNPLLDEMKEFCRLNRVLIKKGGSEVPVNLYEANKKFQEDLRNDSASQVPIELTSVELEPNEQIAILFDYNMAKEREDTEVFTTGYGADSVVLTVVDKGPTRRKVLARSIHRRPLDDDSSPESRGTYNFKLMEYLLPHQGFLVWWKNIPERPDSQVPGAT